MVMAPTLANGKDLLHRDACHGHCAVGDFYKKVFGWQNRKRGRMAARRLTTRWGK